MERSLKRVLDYKLVFECLADGSNGLIPLHTLTARWPTQQEAEGFRLPKGCVEEWKAVANKDGYLNWEGFSTGLARALEIDASRLKELSTTKTLPPETKGYGLGASMLQNPVKAEEIESFLSSCDGRALVQTLARMKKEVYHCQRNLQQMAAAAAREKKDTKSSNDQGKIGSKEPESNASLQGSSPGGTGRGVAIGNEKEELLKGVEILDRTQQWFTNRLEQLALEKSSTRKVRAEELLAIMEGSRHPVDETLQHIQQINQHLNSLATTAPTLASNKQLQGKIRKESAGGKDRRSQRLLSDPGPTTPTKGQKVRRHSSTSPPMISTGLVPTTTSGAHVVALEIPSPTSSTFDPLGFHGMSHGHRSSSMQEIRERPSSARRGLVYTTDGGMAESGSHGYSQKRRDKPRRSNSLNYPEGHGSDLDSFSGTVQNSHNSNSTHQYPLRETVSLNQLPGGGPMGGYAPPRSGVGVAGSGYSSGSHDGGNSFSHMPLKSSSLRNIPSSASREQFHSGSKYHRHSRPPSGPHSSRQNSDKTKKEHLRAKQVAAHQRILNMETYQGGQEVIEYQSVV